MKILKKVSPNLPIAFGGASISGEGRGYGFGPISTNDSIALLEEAFQLGIRIFDAAPVYGFTEAEKRMGVAFKENREKVFLVSKSGVTWHDNRRIDMNNSPEVAVKMLEQSLRDFQSDYIDLYMIHWPSKDIDIRKALEVLAKAQLQGKIKHIGLCNTTLDDFKKASEVADIEVLQSEYNLFNRNCDLLELNKSFMSWGTFDKGILTGRATRNRKYDKDDMRSWAPWWKSSNKDIKQEIMESVIPYINKQGVTAMEVALGFNLSQEGIDVAICGARNVKQLQEIVEASLNPPSQDILDKVVSYFDDQCSNSNL